MIWTITPNPALDLGGLADEIIPNEKSYVHDETRDPGGNGINAARVIRQMRAPVTASGFLGGCAGAEIAELLDAMEVPHRFVPIAGRTRINITVSNLKTHKQTRLSFPGPRIEAGEREGLEKALVDASGDQKPSVVLFGGSLPPDYTTVHAARFLRRMRRLGVPFGLDVPSRALKPLLDEKPFLIKPNLSEFRELVGAGPDELTGRGEVIEAARSLNDRVDVVCISSVERGAVLVTRDLALYGKGPSVEVRSTVGAGDSMVGAMTAHFWKAAFRRGGSIGELGESAFGEALAAGLAAATATLTTPGTQLATARQMRAIQPQVRVERVD